MLIKSAEYVISSARVDQCPQGSLPEFAFIGRSNVGKSSLINMLCHNPKLAKTSQKPGKTLLIWIAFAVPVLGLLFLPEIAVIYIGWAYILFAVSAPAYLAARSQVKVFARFGGPAAHIDPEEDNFYQ